ncbi:SixA phosphatase family protein [Pseudonocardia acidicola]|uniref:Histidine phosphatase family protein n=1 Tax=Pseudonocardia acidicola TaxID=2724939 RepID=A0ABX1SDD1_9PSEU|nr:histidine phosphatase family protein [Pseudonocardia acidicola]NMH99581.1 histidine phosphatase family protein [Pseudonocardia acidicola]
MAATNRRLVIVRHAKSAWPEGVPDVERPLAPRGRRDAPAIGRWLHTHLDDTDGIDAVVCSPALRARQTWQLAATELGDPPPPRFDDRVYAATADELLAVVRELPGTGTTAVLIGHNPGLEDLVELLSGRECVLKTSSVAMVSLPGPWAQAGPRRAHLDAHATPRG